MAKVINWLFPDNNIKALSNIELSRKLYLLDIGARGGIDWPWNVFSSDLLSLIMVEPDPDEANKLEVNNKSNSNSVLPFALWSEKSSLNLYLNNSPGTSSVYKPNKIFLNQFPDAERFDANTTLKINAVTVDDLAARKLISKVDFAKIDIQGAELAVLEGGRSFFSNELIGLEVEVEFSEMYSGQPLFSDIESFVRKELGLELWDIKKTYWKYKSGAELQGPVKGKLIFGDALFLRPIPGLAEWLSEMNTTKAAEKLSMLLVTTLAYGYLDYASALLKTSTITKYLDDKLIADFSKSLERLSGGFRPSRNGNEYIFAFLDALARAFKPAYHGWASIGRRLGTRRRGSIWF